MKFIRCLALAVALSWGQPAWAQEALPPKNALGLGIGESLGAGLVYQHVLNEGLRARVNFGLYPAGGGSYPYSATFLGGGLLQDIGRLAGGRIYVLGTGLYKQVASNEAHLSVMPGAGAQWGPFLLETGASFFRTDRDGGGGAMYTTWGVSAALALGLLWEF